MVFQIATVTVHSFIPEANEWYNIPIYLSFIVVKLKILAMSGDSGI